MIQFLIEIFKFSGIYISRDGYLKMSGDNEYLYDGNKKLLMYGANNFKFSDIIYKNYIIFNPFSNESHINFLYDLVFETAYDYSGIKYKLIFNRNDNAIQIVSVDFCGYPTETIMSKTLNKDKLVSKVYLLNKFVQKLVPKEEIKCKPTLKSIVYFYEILKNIKERSILKVDKIDFEFGNEICTRIISTDYDNFDDDSIFYKNCDNLIL